MKRVRIGVTLLVVLVFLLGAGPVYADTANPDSTPSVESINIYRNSIETGDMLILVYANIPYATLPDLPVTDTFVWRLIDTDNVTEIGSTIGYAYNDDGYGYNVYSMYFSASTVTALGIVWGTTYTMRLSGNPAAFDTPPVYNYTINAGNYSSETAKANVQGEIATRILGIATDLDSRWGLSVSLLTENETATVLSIYGEAFFRGAIHGLQAMAPAVFSVVIRVIEIDARDWEEAYTENVTGQWSGTWIETATEAGKVLFNTEYDFLSMVILLIICGGVMYANIYLGGESWAGWIDVAMVGIIGARLGMYDLAFLGLIGALCIFYISGKIWFGFFK